MNLELKCFQKRWDKSKAFFMLQAEWEWLWGWRKYVQKNVT